MSADTSRMPKNPKMMHAHAVVVIGRRASAHALPAPATTGAAGAAHSAGNPTASDGAGSWEEV